MQNWDDLRFFLAIARAGSVSAAAVELGVNQSTVSRRINAYEESIKVRLFDRLTSGYVLTQEGKDLLQYAQRMEDESFAIERHIVGKNRELCGPIRVTAPVLLATHVLMPVFERFLHAHPEIELQVDVSNNIYNLSQREADVAVRITQSSPPENLIGRRLGSIEMGVYGSKVYLESWHAQVGQALKWIGEDNNAPRPHWLPESYSSIQLTMRANDPLVTVGALQLGLGVGRLPVIIGDGIPELQRLDNIPELPSMELWVLTHPDIRHVSRIDQFVRFVAEEVRSKLHHDEASPVNPAH